MQINPMEDRNISRRNWIESLGQGFGGLVLGAMLDRDKTGASALGAQTTGTGIGSGGSLRIASQAQGQACRAVVHGRGGQPSGSVRFQRGAGQATRSGK
jgi:hypothetical protein